MDFIKNTCPLPSDCYLEILDINSGDIYRYYDSDYDQELFDQEFEKLSKILDEMDINYDDQAS